MPRTDGAVVRLLADLPERREAVIAMNPDRASRAMGLAPGAHVRMFRNRGREQALVVGLGDARFLVSRSIAGCVALAGTGGGSP